MTFIDKLAALLDAATARGFACGLAVSLGCCTLYRLVSANW
jgi:hypothetical protein